MTVTFDTSILLGWYQAKAGLAAAQYAPSNGTATAATAAMVPTAPWGPGQAQPKDSALVTQALTGKPFIDEKAAKLDVANANADYKKLFAINQGLLTLQALANAANDPKTSSFQLTAIQAAFDRGMAELGKYVEGTKFGEFRLTQGVAVSSATSAAGVMTSSDSYVTAPLATGTSADPVAAFQGATQFDMTVTRPAIGTTPARNITINFDLSEMGSTPRSMSNVADYMNTKLKAAGVGVQVAVDRQSVPAQTTTVNGTSVELTPATTQFAFKITGLSAEHVTFSAPTTAPAVYVAQTAGDPDPDANATTDDSDQQQELLKLDGSADGVRRPGDTNYVSGRVFSEKLPDGVTTVHQMVTGADGSVYMVADGSGTVDDQPVKGSQDAVLLKYDAAGTLIYSRTLGAGASASGASLAVSADGKVAIAGQITGELDQGDAGADANTPDSFVTVFDNQGQELWTDRQGALGEDQAQAVAFDANGNVYVAGKTKGTIGGGTAVGGWDAYLRAYNTSGKVQSTKQFGSVADDSVAGIVVNGTNVLVAGQDGAAATVRSIDVTNPKQMTVTASRNLGSLGGGAITGIGLDASGNLLLGGSAGTNLSVGNVTMAKSGGIDAFGARISTDLTSTASDALAYYGGSGTDRATAATIANGQVWLTGTSKTDLPGLATPVGKQDGFVAALDVGAGAVTYSQRFTAKDQMAAPEAIAVDATGGSALDRLGLPKGQLQYDSSTLITAVTSARAGDQFQIRMSGSSVPSTITIDATDTLTTLSDKIRRAGLFDITVTSMFTGTETQLQLKPANNRTSFELLNGPPGRDALDALGLPQGLVRNTIADKTKGVIPADKGTQTYGLHLDTNLDLSSKTDIKTALDSVTNAITTVRAIYADLKQAATPKDPTAGATGEVPAYLQAQIADYTAALARLTAGSDSSSGSSSLVSLLG